MRPLLSFRGQCGLTNEPSFLTEVLSVAQKTGECEYETEICMNIILILLLKLLSQVPCKLGPSALISIAQCMDRRFDGHSFYFNGRNVKF